MGWNVFFLKRRRPNSSVGSAQDLKTGSHWFDLGLGQNFFKRNDDSHCDRIYCSLTAVHCFPKGYIGKQPVAWKEYCAEYWLKILQESMDRCTGRCNINEILLKRR